jgi:hypothetical protein
MFVAVGLTVPETTNDKPVKTAIGAFVYWLNKDSRGAIWINGDEVRAPKVDEPKPVENVAPVEVAPVEVTPVVVPVVETAPVQTEIFSKDTALAGIRIGGGGLSRENARAGVTGVSGGYLRAGAGVAGDGGAQADVCGARGRDFLAQQKPEGRFGVGERKDLEGRREKSGGRRRDGKTYGETKSKKSGESGVNGRRRTQREMSRWVRTLKPWVLRDWAATSMSSMFIARADLPSGRLMKL